MPHSLLFDSTKVQVCIRSASGLQGAAESCPEATKGGALQI